MSDPRIAISLSSKDDTSGRIKTSLDSITNSSDRLKRANDSLRTSYVNMASALYVYQQGMRLFKGINDTFIESSNRQEDAVNRLNNAMILQGSYTSELSAEYQEYAKSIQKSTRYGDEAILEMMQQLISVGDVGSDMMTRATAAALDFAAATGRDLSTAALTVGKAMTGFTGELSRYGIIIDENIPKTEKARAALEAMEKQFGGFAQKDLGTFSAATDQLGNSWGDLAEEIGDFVKNTELVKETITALKTATDFYSESLHKLNQQRKAAITEQDSQIGYMKRELEAVEQAIRQWEAFRVLNESDAVSVERYNTLLTQQMRLRETIARMSVELEPITIGGGKKEEDTSAVDIYVQQEQEKINKLRDIWSAWYEEDSQMKLTALQSESEQLNYFINLQKTASQSMWSIAQSATQTFTSGVSSALTSLITQSGSAQEAISAIGPALIQIFVDFMVQKAASFALSKVLLAGEVKTSQMAAAATATAWAKAAAMVSLATFGANAIPASAGIISTVSLAQSLAALDVGTAASGARVAGGRAIPIIAHEGEYIGTPAALASAGIGGNNGGDTFNINIDNFNGDDNSIKRLVDELGYKTQIARRYSRGI